MSIDTRYNIVRKEFYRLWTLSKATMKYARTAAKEGREEEARGAMSAFRLLSKQAREAHIAMNSMREPRPAIVDTGDKK